jgi:hypothetical protein
MLILKRLGVWVFETVFIAVLVGVFLYLWWGALPRFDEHQIVENVFGYAALVTLYFMVLSGYLVTTCLAATFVRHHVTWWYPAIVAVLFVAHLQLMPAGWTQLERLPISAVGASISLVVAFAGNLLLHNGHSACPNKRTCDVSA